MAFVKDAIFFGLILMNIRSYFQLSVAIFLSAEKADKKGFLLLSGLGFSGIKLAQSNVVPLRRFVKSGAMSLRLRKNELNLPGLSNYLCDLSFVGMTNFLDKTY
jgi:hypothetical protein